MIISSLSSNLDKKINVLRPHFQRYWKVYVDMSIAFRQAEKAVFVLNILRYKTSSMTNFRHGRYA